MSAADLRTGNAADHTDTRGWLVGHFISDGPGRTTGVEVKWGVHPAGETRADWVAAETETRTTLLILVSGRFRLDLPDQAIELARPGDYVLWPPGVAHSWAAAEDSVCITVRWPTP